ncbi:hypothetical protein [Pelagibius litoralis]|uniref:hypothetical protein n=1 Tax=Pelagibius litoralis TaxID=374515 RepID=UPI001980DDB9|nr:hypothetical protein [Pelagibius litoralis]
MRLFFQGTVVGFAALLVLSAAPASAEDDPFGADWPEGPGREEAGYLCGACHSLRLVTQQGLSRLDWDETLDWMVEEQEMEEPEAVERALILSFLSEHFGVDHRPRHVQAAPGSQVPGSQLPEIQRMPVAP